jgi:hypothetical protein
LDGERLSRRAPLILCEHAIPERIVFSQRRLCARGLSQKCFNQTIAACPSHTAANRGDHGERAVYIADAGNHRVRRIAPGGVLRPIAGTGEQAFRRRRRVSSRVSHKLISGLYTVIDAIGGDPQGQRAHGGNG